jgi:hypothetical protein
MEKDRPKTIYKRFQFGWVIVIMFVIICIWMTFAYINQWGNSPVDTPGYIFFMILFGGILSGFYGMTVIVTEKQIKIKFGIGFYTKKIDLATVGSVSILTYPFYCGYGIRLLPHGILYNVSGKHAVELTLKHKKSVIQIGTDDWDKLSEVVKNRITK